ncbi:hypothetical protein CFOL_v3_33958 [Cephalotus follicularis]|uniref:Uncharacterized protein n=1 Tax=Cephalotus follicularis TaxID=3775 RepID=A0A1Q3DDP9_CEPFO|nr:hypothetical protein CFOL_v3_33958 [Cephalotus follicularis]
MDSESFKMINWDFVKLDHFYGNNFSRRQEKMKFLLTVLKIAYVLDPSFQPVPEDPQPIEGQQPDAAILEPIERAKEKKGLKMRNLLRDISSIHYLIVFTTFTPTLNLQENYGRCWSSNIKLRRKVLINIRFLSTLILKWLILNLYWRKCMNCRLL